MARQSDIERILANGESANVEFTESLRDSDKYCKAICAFANDIGGTGEAGYLIVGVDRKGIPTGASIKEQLLESLAGHRNNGQLLPVPDLHVEKHALQGGEIAVVIVRPSDAPPVRYKQVVYIRTGPTGGIATAEQERRLEERRVDKAITWDMRSCPGASLGDLALEVFTMAYLPRAVSPQVLDENGRSIERQLSSLRLYNAKMGLPTNGAVILFGCDPLAFFPGAYVQYVRYEGTDQSSRVLIERRIEGDMPTILRDLDALARGLAGDRPERTSDLSEQTVSDYPAVALHELFVNAIIHRNYDGSTTPVSINQFSDRLEITNPGSLYGDLARDQFPGGTAYRNPLLAEAAKIFGFANRFGRGVAIAKDALAQNGSPELTYTIGDNHISMMVRRRL